MAEKNFWNEMRRFRDRMNKFFSYPDFPEKDSEGYGKPQNYRKAWTDLKETETNFVIDIELPGISKEDIKLDISDEPKAIEIKAEKRKESEDEEDTYSYSRIYSGFYRMIELPALADIDNINAEYKGGILKITIPKLKSEPKNKRSLSIR